MKMKNRYRKASKFSREEKIYHILICPIMVLFILICGYPFYYLLIGSISDPKLVTLGKIVLWPEGINFHSYAEVFKNPNLVHSAWISVCRVLSGTALSLFVCAYSAYFFSKTKMWGRKFWYRMVVVTMYFSAGMIPTYLNYKMFGMLNSFWIYIIPGCLSVYNMILIKTSMESMPADLEESAFLDGAGYFTRLILIVLPLQKPILATVGLFSAVGHWNDFFRTKLYVNNSKLYTLQFQLYELLNQVREAALQDDELGVVQVTSVSVRMALTAVVVIPAMCVYPFIQKFYVKGIMIGAVKG